MTTSGKAIAAARAIRRIWNMMGHAASEAVGWSSRAKLDVTIGCMNRISTEVAARGSWNQNS